MNETLEFLEKLPMSDEEQVLPQPWVPLCESGLALAQAELIQALDEIRGHAFPKSVPRFEIDYRMWANPWHNLGSIVLCPSDAYCEKTQQPGLSERRNYHSGYVNCGVEIEVVLIRRMPAFGDLHYPSHVSFELHLHHRREIDGFRDLFNDYRGIVGKLLEAGAMTFETGNVIDSVERTRSKNPLVKLGAALNDSTTDINNLWFHLEFRCQSNTSRLQALRSLAAQCVLFECIQRVSVSARAKRDVILAMWIEFDEWCRRVPGKQS